MGELMEALIKYHDSDNTKDPWDGYERSNKSKKSSNGKGRQQNMAMNNGNNQGHGGKRRHPDGRSDLVANTNTGYKGERCNCNGKPSFGWKNFNLQAMFNEPCPKHSLPDKPASHA